VPVRGHSAKSENKLSDCSSFSFFLFSHALFSLARMPAATPVTRRRAVCPPPRCLPAVLAPPHAGPLPRSCSRSTPCPLTQAPAHLLAAAATRRAGPLGAPAHSPRPCPPRPPHPLTRRVAASPHATVARYKLYVFILFICMFICMFMILTNTCLY
jgi:hypothetical protein